MTDKPQPASEQPRNRCHECGHTNSSHFPECGALDAAGDECDCDSFKTAPHPAPADDAPTRNSKVLTDFVAYCQAHPEQCFWQALRNWSGLPFIAVTQEHPDTYNTPYDDGILDTFHWEGHNG